MLSRDHRLTRGADYKSVVRKGRRAAGEHLVIHVLHEEADRPARFGFIVTKQLGNAVMRNTVRRRLKAICSGAATQIAPGTDVVFRVRPSAASADFAALRSDALRLIERRAR